MLVPRDFDLKREYGGIIILKAFNQEFGGIDKVKESFGKKRSSESFKRGIPLDGRVVRCYFKSPRY